jgi:hypothetical protein
MTDFNFGDIVLDIKSTWSHQRSGPIGTARYAANCAQGIIPGSEPDGKRVRRFQADLLLTQSNGLGGNPPRRFMLRVVMLCQIGPAQSP